MRLTHACLDHPDLGLFLSVRVIRSVHVRKQLDRRYDEPATLGTWDFPCVFTRQSRTSAIRSRLCATILVDVALRLDTLMPELQHLHCIAILRAPD